MLSVVSISYGRQWLTSEAIACIKEADTVIGYQGFIDEVRDLLKPNVNSYDILDDIRQDENFLIARVRHAVAEVDNNKQTIILSNGDTNIFGMSGAVYRELIRLKRNDLISKIKVVPGISALQIAAARIGGPLSNGFATLALCIAEVSENSVFKKVTGCALGDFVTVIYMLRHNAEMFPKLHPEITKPRELSNKRLLEMIKIFRSHRHDDTPCVVGSNLGRANEKMYHYSLGNLEHHLDNITATSILFIGSTDTINFGKSAGCSNMVRELTNEY